jgi:hypothetical protein
LLPRLLLLQHILATISFLFYIMFSIAAALFLLLLSVAAVPAIDNHHARPLARYYHRSGLAYPTSVNGSSTPIPSRTPSSTPTPTTNTYSYPSTGCTVSTYVRSRLSTAELIHDSIPEYTVGVTKYLHKQPSASVLVVALLYTASMYLGQHLPNSVHQSLNPNLLGG